MSESGWYPAGAEHDPEAPWNQSDPEPVLVEVTISQSLSRSAEIEVTDYVAEVWEDCEPDGEGGLYRTGGINYDFSDSDLKRAYEDQEYTIPELLDYLKAYLIADIAECSEGSSKQIKLQHILACCQEWITDETVVVNN